MTFGTVDAVNVTVNVAYDNGTARFVNQIVIVPGSFSDSGDSGSLIVTDDGNNNPVGLLFAGSSTHTVANPISAVLARFNVGVGGVVPTPITDIAITDVSPSSNNVVKNETVTVDVTVKNVGNRMSAATWILQRLR